MVRAWEELLEKHWKYWGELLSPKSPYPSQHQQRRTKHDCSVNWRRITKSAATGPTARSQLHLYSTADIQSLHQPVKPEKYYGFHNHPFYIWMYTTQTHLHICTYIYVSFVSNMFHVSTRFSRNETDDEQYSLIHLSDAVPMFCHYAAECSIENRVQKFLKTGVNRF